MHKPVPLQAFGQECVSELNNDCTVVNFLSSLYLVKQRAESIAERNVP